MLGVVKQLNGQIVETYVNGKWESNSNDIDTLAIGDTFRLLEPQTDTSEAKLIHDISGASIFTVTDTFTDAYGRNCVKVESRMEL